MCKKLTHKDYLEKSMKVHGNKYDYIEEYKGSATHIEIKCKKHNHIFKQKPNKHFQGQGCPICGRNIYIERKNDYILLFEKIHNDKFVKISH